MTLALRTLSTADAGFEADFQRVLHWSAETDAAIEGRVAQIIDDVRTVVSITFRTMGRLTERLRAARTNAATTPNAAASVGVATPR